MKKCISINHYSPGLLLRKEGTFNHTCPECKHKCKYKIKFYGKDGEDGLRLTHENGESFLQLG